MTIQDQLFALQDEKYADFQSKLVPNVEREKIIGVRIPESRKLAKSLMKQGKVESFLQELPHEYYDENILHALLLSEFKDFKDCIQAIERFLPYVDNWAVCDGINPKMFKKHKVDLLVKIREWLNSDQTYTVRFALRMLMNHFLEEEFQVDFLDLAAEIHSDEYYLQMMQAWFFATALDKQWKATISYLQEERLDLWVHNKSIQKACESRKIATENKEYLKTLKLR